MGPLKTDAEEESLLPHAAVMAGKKKRLAGWKEILA